MTTVFVNMGTGNLWGQAVVSNCEGSRQEKEGLICLGGRTPTNFETWVSVIDLGAEHLAMSKGKWLISAASLHIC